VGAGIGILLLGLHSLIDYNLNIPANVVYFAYMAGIFLSDPAAGTETTGRGRRPRRTPDLEDAAGASSVPPGTAAAPGPQGQIKNPFLD
jgi:hypothetical protein